MLRPNLSSLIVFLLLCARLSCIPSLAASATAPQLVFMSRADSVGFSLIRPAAYGVDFYGDCLFTSERDGKHHLRYQAQMMQQLMRPELVEIGQMPPDRWPHIADSFVRNKMARPDYSFKGFISTPGRDFDLIGLLQLIGLLTLIIAGITVVAVTLFILNKRLQQEIENHETTEAARQESERKLISYSNQMEQFSLSAASMLSMRDEKLIFAKISRAIVDYSDFRRVLITLFKDEAPYRDLIGYGGISEEIVEKVRRTPLPESWYDEVFRQGILLGQFSYYIPHTMKGILNQEATIFGEGPPPEDADVWHPGRRSKRPVAGPGISFGIS